MHYPRAILISFMSYILTLLVTAAILLLAGKEFSSIQAPTRGMILLSMVVAGVCTTLAAVVYFKPASVPASGKLGLRFGIIAVLVSFVTDAALAGIISLQGRHPLDLFSTAYEPQLLGPLLLLGLAATTIVGSRMGKQQIS